jgi:hypothetical protein
MKAITLAVALILFAVPASAQLVTTIYDIQNGTVPTGTYVRVENVIVTAGPDEFTTSGAYCFIEESMGGPYSGLELYWGSANAETYAYLERGDIVTVVGYTGEYFDLTEIDASFSDCEVIFVSSGPEMYPDYVTTAGMMDEQWEGVLVTTCCSFVTALLPYGEWEIDDGQGPGICDDKGLNLTYTPVVGHEAHWVGILSYAYGDYRLWPRDNDDIDFCASATEAVSWASIKSLF